MLYKSKNLQNNDIYPIRVIKAKTLQYYNENNIWLIDTNGTNIINIICSNIVLVLSKVNNDFFESGEFDSTLFVDNHNFIQELDDKKIRNQLLSSIKDLIVSHNLNYKEVVHKKENVEQIEQIQNVQKEVENIKKYQYVDKECSSDEEN